MKIGEFNHIETSTFGEVDSIQAKIADDSMSFLFEMMSKSLYSNPIGSIVREITSNCFDSHKEANVDDAVIIRKSTDEDGLYISFIDFGVGLSPDRIKNVYMNYFSSTKRGDNEQIGGFGLGSKTPLSYVDFFYIITTFNNIKYTYVLSKGEKAPTLDLMSEEETTDKNGTEIKIYINRNDEYKFKTQLIKQLCYFDNVYFDNWNINNNYRIYDCKYFKYKNIDQYSDECHIVLGKVSYPIDWTELGIDPFPVPIGVKFEIGELIVTPNREALRYTDEIKVLVKDRINSARNECIDLFERDNRILDNYFEWYALKGIKPFIKFEHNISDANGNITVIEDKLYLNNVKSITKRHKCSIFNGITFLEKDDLLKELYVKVGDFSGGIINRSKYLSNNLLLNWSTTNTFLTNDENVNVIKEEFAFTFRDGRVFKPKKLNTDDLKMNGSLREIFIGKIKIKGGDFEVNYKPRFGDKEFYFNLGNGIKLYNAIKTIREQTEIKYYNRYTSINEEQKTAFKKWKDANNYNLQRKLQGKVLVHNIASNRTDSYDWKVADEFIVNGKFKTIVTGIENYKGIVVYGFRENLRKLKEAVIFLGQFKTLCNGLGERDVLNKEACRVLQISQQNEKYFINKPNMIHVDNLYGDNKLFRRFASSLKIEEYFREIGSKRSNSIEDFISQIKSLCTGAGNELEFLYKYYKKYSYTGEMEGSSIKRNEIKNMILALADEKNLFDPLTESSFKQLDEWFKGVELIQFTEINDESLPFIIKLLVTNKKKLNLEYYQKYYEVYDIDNIKAYQVKDSDRNLIGIQQTLTFDSIKEEVDQPKLKLILKKAA